MNNEIDYMKFADYQTHVGKEFRFKNKSKRYIEIWITKKNDNDKLYEHSELLKELLGVPVHTVIISKPS
jgi:hypothetical protein